MGEDGRSDGEGGGEENTTSALLTTSRESLALCTPPHADSPLFGLTFNLTIFAIGFDGKRREPRGSMSVIWMKTAKNRNLGWNLFGPSTIFPGPLS
jgi:hypothetical protein